MLSEWNSEEECFKIEQHEFNYVHDEISNSNGRVYLSDEMEN